jgi:hypothetical protein
MPRMRCPGCKRILRIDESSRGDVIGCPKCARRFAVPRFAEDDEPLDEPAPYVVKDEPAPPRPSVPKLRDDDEGDEDRPVIRRRRRRREAPTGLPDFLAQWNLDKVLLVGSVGLWFVLLGLALVERGFAIGLFAGGLLLLFAARIWATAAAVNEGVGSGCFIMISPWFFLASLFNLEDRRPLFLFGVGILYLLTGLALLSIFYGKG